MRGLLWRLPLLMLLAAAPAGLAQTAPSMTVTPNAPYVPGANAIVVEGGGAAADVAARIEADSGRPVQALWVLQAGQWRYYLPAKPFIDGGLTQFSPAPVAAIVVIASPARAPGAPHKTVVLDPGHSADEIGAAANGVVEKESNLDMARRVEALLQAQGVRVVLTRTDDGRSVLFPVNRVLSAYAAQRADLQARVDLANMEQADLFVSLHSNGSTVAGQRGVEVWYDPNRPFADRNIALARRLQARVLEELNGYGYAAVDRGLKDDSCFRMRDGRCFQLAVLGPSREIRRADIIRFGGDPEQYGLAPGQDVIMTRPTQMPGALVEMLFVSDPQDAAVLRDGAARDAMARGVARAIIDSLSEDGAAVSSAPAAPVATPAAVRSGPAEVIASGGAGRRMVALTFDAGADTGFAAGILDTLHAEGVAASFGMTGVWAKSNPELVRRMVREGHQLINHTYDHRSFTSRSTNSRPLTQAQRWDEIDRTEEIVRSLTGATTKPYFRPPYGDYDASVNADVGARGYSYNVMWTIDSLGWNGLPAAQIVTRCLNAAAPGAIFIFHVGAASQDAAALPAIIAGLRRQGYAFGTVADVLAP